MRLTEPFAYVAGLGFDLELSNFYENKGILGSHSFVDLKVLVALSITGGSTDVAQLLCLPLSHKTKLFTSDGFQEDLLSALCMANRRDVEENKQFS